MTAWLRWVHLFDASVEIEAAGSRVGPVDVMADGTSWTFFFAM
jgi:hypothetical protein